MHVHKRSQNLPPKICPQSSCGLAPRHLLTLSQIVRQLHSSMATWPANQPVTFLYNLPAMSNTPSPGHSNEASTPLVDIHRSPDVLTFTLNNPDHGNEITGPMFDAMLAELRSEATRPSARVLRLRARGKVFCTGRERAGRDAAAIHKEVS